MLGKYNFKISVSLRINWWKSIFDFYQFFILEGAIINKPETQINDEITDKEVRVLGPDGEQLGLMSAYEANKKAEDMGYDLVKISPNAVPPVCRIMDYSKYKFDQAKRLKELKKNQKVIEVKEIQLSMTIELHDMQVKAKHANRFLTSGDKVKVVLRMRGRQQAYANKGIEIVNSFVDMVAEVGEKEKEPKVEGRNIIVIVQPKKKQCKK